MKTLIILLLFIGMLVAVGIVAVGLIPLKPFLPGIAILEFGIVIYGFFWLFARKNVYQCERCNRYFALSPISNIMAIKAIDTRFVRCPACGHSEYNISFPRKEVLADIIEPGQIKSPEDENWTRFYIQLAVVSIMYLAFVVMFIFFWESYEGYLNLALQTMMNIKGDLLLKLSAISALYALYLSIFISAIRQRYKTGMYLALTVILLVSVVVILLIEYSHFIALRDAIKSSGCA
jgi:hypothetical protein